MVMAPGFGAGVMELLMVLLMGGGLPVGMPPLPDDPRMSQVAPEQALVYLSWAGTGDADGKSANTTERLLADPQVKFLIKSIEDAVLKYVISEAPGPEEERLVKAGHLLIKQMLLRPTTIYLSKFNPFDGAPVVEAGMVINFGKDAPAAKAALELIEKLIANELGGEFQVMPANQGGLRRMPIPDDDAPLVAWGFEGEYMMLAVGKETAARLRGALTGGKAPQWLTDVKKKITLPRHSALVYTDVKALIKQFGPMITGQLLGDPEASEMMTRVLGAMGLDKVNYLAAATGFDETKFVTRTLIATQGRPGGIFKIISEKGLTAKDLAQVPKDADLALVIKLSPTEIWNEVMKIMAAIDPGLVDEFEGEMQQATRELGFDIKADLFDSIGDVWSLYNSPGEGGLVITGLTGVVTVKNAQKAQKVIDQLEKSLLKEFNWGDEEDRQWRRVEIKTLVVGQHKIRYINPVGDDWVVAPAWCLTGDRFILAAYPQMVKAYLMRQSNKDAATLASVPQVKMLLGADGNDGPAMITYMDTPELFKKFYPLAFGLGTALFSELQSEGIDLDVAILPTASAILPHLTPDTETTRWTADGVLSESRSTLPIASSTLLTLPMIGISSFAAMAPAEEFFFDPDMEDADVIPARRADQIAPPNVIGVARPGPAAKRTMAMNDLRQMGIALFVYHSEKNAAAPTLADLKPYLGKEIKADPWGQPYLYYGKNLAPAGQNASKTPFISTTHTIDGKRLVLYGDAHVEAIDEKEFKKQMEAAKLEYKEPVEVKDDEKDAKDGKDAPDLKRPDEEKNHRLEKESFDSKSKGSRTRNVPVPARDKE